MMARGVRIFLFCCWTLSAAAADPDHYFQEARDYLNNGEPRAAVIQLKNLLRLQPENGEARLLLGEAYLRLGEGAGAVKELKRARDLGMESSRWLSFLAQAYLLQGEAQELLDNILPEASQSPKIKAKILAMRAAACLLLDQHEKAKDNLNQALQLDPDNLQAHLGRARLALNDHHLDEVFTHIDRVLKQDPDNVEAYLLQAEAYRQQEDLQAAYQSYGEVLERRPREIRALLGRATVELANNQNEQARKDLDAVDKIAKDVPLALYMRGLLEFRQGNLEAAKEALEKVVYKVPNHAQSTLLLGIIAYRHNELGLAEEYLEATHHLMPDSFPVTKVLAAIKIKRKQPQAAVSLLEPYRQQLTNDPQYLALLGSAYLQNHQFDEGNEVLAEAARLAPDVAAIQTQLALGQIAAGDLTNAVGHLEQAVDLKQGLMQADVMLVLARMKQKKYPQALETARRLAEKMPNSPMPRNLIASTYLAMGEAGKAEQQWTALLQEYPDYSTAALNLAKLKFHQGRLKQAENYYRRVIDKRSGHVGALVGLAQIAEARKKYSQMVHFLEQAHERHPEALKPSRMLVRYYLAAGDPLKALGVARTLVEHQDRNPLALQLLGQAQLAANRPASAVASFRNLTILRPENPSAWHFLALALERNKDDAGALDAWDKALSLQEDFLPGAADRIRLLLKLKRYNEALEGAKKLQSHNTPDLAVGYFWEGEIALAQKHTSEALNAFRKAHDLAPSQLTSQRLYQLYRKTGEQEKGRSILESWLEKTPDDAGSWMMLAVGYQEEGNDGQAIAAYEKALALQPDNVLTLNNLAWLYHKTGDSKSLTTAQRLIDLGKDKPEVLDTVGWIYLHNGRPEEGLTLLKEAAVRAPHLPAIRLHLAEALIQQGRENEAARELKRLLRDQTHFAQRRHAQELLDSVSR